MGPGGSLLLSQKPEARPYPEPNQSSKYSSYPDLEIHFNIIFQSTPLSSKLFNSFRSPHQNPACIIPFPNTCYMPHTFNSSLFIRPNNIWWGLQIKELLVNVVFSIPLLPRPHETQIPSSAPYSQNLWAYVPPSVSETKFRTHAKQLAKLSNRIRDL